MTVSAGDAMAMSGHCATPQSAPSPRATWGPHELCRKPGCPCACHGAAS